MCRQLKKNRSKFDREASHVIEPGERRFPPLDLDQKRPLSKRQCRSSDGRLLRDAEIPFALGLTAHNL